MRASQRATPASNAGQESSSVQSSARLAALSDREREVAVAVGQGRSNAEIAGELYMSVATVKAHVSHILTQLELTNRVQIAICVHDAGLV